MMGIFKCKGHKAKVVYDPEIEMLRGEILGLSGGADFYAESVTELESEFKKSLEVYLEVCEEKGIDPYKSYSGNLPYRTNPNRHQEIEEAAASKGLSINKFIDESVSRSLDALA
jgi:predicted HicB family RNase H-like nuclease